MKKTEIGLIPDDWKVKSIEEFADVTTGNKNTQDAVENGKYPFAQASCLETDGNNLWVGSLYGICVYNESGKFVNKNDFFPLPSKIIWDILWDGEQLWISTQKGISFFNSTTIDNIQNGIKAKQVFIYYSLSLKIQNVIYIECTLSMTALLWISTIMSIIVLKTKEKDYGFDSFKRNIGARVWTGKKRMA